MTQSLTPRLVIEWWTAWPPVNDNKKTEHSHHSLLVKKFLEFFYYTKNGSFSISWQGEESPHKMRLLFNIIYFSVLGKKISYNPVTEYKIHPWPRNVSPGENTHIRHYKGDASNAKIGDKHTTIKKYLHYNLYYVNTYRRREWWGKITLWQWQIFDDFIKCVFRTK